MSQTTDMLDEEFAGHFGCRAEDLRAGKVLAIAGGRAPLTVVATEAGGIVSSSLLDRGQLAAAVEGVPAKDLLDEACIRRLVGLLPVRSTAWQVGETDILLYCTPETFRPCAGATTEPVRPDDVLWQEARQDEREFAEAGKTRHVDAAFAVYVGPVRASTARLIDQGRPPFRAVGIATEPPFRGRGYAKACVSAATAWALERELVPLYNTQAGNAASIAVARAVGYVEYFRRLTAS